MRYEPLIDWVDAMCRVWGLQRRRFDFPSSHTAHPESVFARIRDGVPPETFARQHFAEHLRGEALEIQRRLHHLTEKQREALWVHYVIPGLLKQKLPVLNLSKAAHFERLHKANTRLAATLAPDKVWPTQDAESVQVSRQE